MCDNPGRTEADYLTMLRQLIDEHGWAIQGVEPDGGRPGWAYTVGLTVKGLPELVVTGVSMSHAAELLNFAAGLVTEGTGLPGGLDVEVVTVARPWAHLRYAVTVYGEDIKALQLVYPDTAGRWPWDAGYAMPGGPQPVLGIRGTS